MHAAFLDCTKSVCCDTMHMLSVGGRTSPAAQDACQEDDMMDIEAAIRALEAEVIGSSCNV